MIDHIPSVIITGASGGIGGAVARRFAREGYRLFLHAFRHMDALEALAGEFPETPVVAMQADLSDFASIERMFAQHIFPVDPQPDVLVNNAGVACFSLLQDMTESEWDRVMNINLKAVFGCCHQVLPSMIGRRSGSIVNISSMWGVSGASMETAYSAAKGGLNALSRALGKELAPSGIRVNAVACGVIDTGMNRCLTPQEQTALADEIPMGRFGRPEEVADLVWYLAGSASAYLTGQVITLDGAYL